MTQPDDLQMLNAMVNKLAATRAEEHELQIEYTRRKEAFEQETADLSYQLGVARNHRQNLEESIRAAALLIQDSTGNREPHPAVEIKMFDTVILDPEEARAWCLHNAPGLLVLDIPTYEKLRREIAKSQALSSTWFGTMPGTVTKQPRAQIKTDLTAWEAAAWENNHPPTISDPAD